MNAKEKKIFVSKLLDSVNEKLNSAIDSGKIPEEWDGFELRQLISDNLATFKMSRFRKAAYDNAVLINNL